MSKVFFLIGILAFTVGCANIPTIGIDAGGEGVGVSVGDGVGASVQFCLDQGGFAANFVSSIPGIGQFLAEQVVGICPPSN